MMTILPCLLTRSNISLPPGLGESSVCHCFERRSHSLALAGLELKGILLLLPLNVSPGKSKVLGFMADVGMVCFTDC